MSSIISTSTTPATKAAFSSLSAPTTKAANTSITATDTSTTTGTSPIPAAIDAATETTTSTTTAIPTATTTTTTTTTAALTSTTPTATSTTAIATTLAASANTANTDTPPRRSLTIPTSHITVHPASPIRTDSTPTPTPKSSSPTFKSTSLPRPPRSDTSSSSPTPISAIPPPLTRADTASSSPTAISAIPPHLSRAYTADDSSIPLSAIPPLFARAYLRNNDPSPTPTLASPSSYSHISYLPADSPSPTPSSPTLTISPPRALTRGPDPSASPPLDPAMPPSLARVYTDGHTDPAAISPQAVETMASNSMVISEVSVGSPPSSDIHSRRTSPFAVSPLPRPSPSHRLTTTNRTRESSMLSEIQEGDWSFSAVHTSEAGSSLPVSPARSRQSSSIADAMLNSKPSKSKQQPGMEVVANGDAEVIDGQVFPALHHEAPSPSLPTSTKATPMKVAVPAPASLVNDRSPYPHSSPLPFRSQHSPSQSSHLPSHLPDSLSLFPTSSSFTPKLSPYTSQKNSPAAVSHYLSSSLSSYPMPLQTTPSFEDVSVYPAFPPAISPSDHSHWDGPGQIMSQLDSTGQNRPSISAQVDSNTQQRDSITTNTHHLRPSISSPSPYPQHSPPSTTSFLGPMETNAHLGTNVSLYPLQLPHSPAAVASTSPQPSPPYPLPIPHSPTTALSTSPMYAQRSSYSQTTRSSSPGLGHGQPNPSTTNSSPGLTHLTPSHPARERKRKESKHSRQRSKDDWDVLSSAKPKPKPRLREKKHNRQRSRDDFSIDYDIAVQGVPQEDVNNMPAVSPDESRLSRSRSTSRIAHRSSLHEEKFPPPPPPPQPLTDPEAFMAAADVSGFLLPTPTHYVKSPRKVSTNSTVARIRSFGTPGQALRKLANRMTPGFSSRSIAKFGASSRATPRPAKASSRSTRNAIGSSSRARRQSGEEDHDSYPTIGTPQNGDSNGRLDPSGRGVGTPHMASTPHTYPSLLESMEMSEHPIAREKVPSLAMRDLPFTSLPQMHDALQTLSHTALRDMTSNVSNANSLARSYSAAPPSVNLGEPHMYARTSTTSTIGSFTTGLHMTAPNSPMHSQSPSPHVDAMRLSQSLPKSWGSQHGLEEIDLRKMAIADCQQEIAELSERIRTDPGGGYEMLGLQLVHLLQRQGGHERRLRELEQERQGGHERRLRELEQAEGQGGHERRLRELDQAEDKTPSSKTTTPSKATSSLAVPLPSSALRPQQPQRTVPPLTATPAKPLHVAVMAKHPALTTQQHLRRQPGSNEEFGEEQLGEDIDKDGGYTVSRTYPAARRALQMRNQQSVINTTRELQNRDMSVQIHVVSPRPSKRQLIPSPTRSQSASPQFAPQTSPLQLQSQTSPQLQPRASPLQLQSQTSPQLQPRARQEVVQRGRSATPPATADPVNPFSPGDRHVERLSIVAQNRGPTGEIPHYIEAFSPVASMNLASLGGVWAEGFRCGLNGFEAGLRVLENSRYGMSGSEAVSKCGQMASHSLKTLQGVFRKTCQPFITKLRQPDSDSFLCAQTKRATNPPTLFVLCDEPFITASHTWKSGSHTVQAQLLRRIANLRESVSTSWLMMQIRSAGCAFLNAVYAPVPPIQLLSSALISCVRYNTTNANCENNLAQNLLEQASTLLDDCCDSSWIVNNVGCSC
eukprot:g2120.t1